MEKVGRNDPCPCGSGRKYKRCCLTKNEFVNAAPSSNHASHRDAMERLFQWSDREEWAELCYDTVDLHLLGEFSERLRLDRQEIVDLLGEERLANVVACAMEDLATARFEPDDLNLVDDYLKRRGWNETEAAREYLRAVRDSVMSLYEVRGVDPGISVTLSDLLRKGKPVVVTEHLASQQLLRWDVLACRVVPADGALRMTGGSLLFLPEWADEWRKIFAGMLRDARREAKAEAVEQPVTADYLLRDTAHALSSFWLVKMIAAAIAPLPDLQNYEGHKLSFTQSRFTFAPCDCERIVERLDALTSLERGDDADKTTWYWHSEPAAGVAEDLYERITLGNLILEEDQLVLETNSVERGERGRRLVVDALGELVKQGLVSVQDAKQAINEHRAKPRASKRERESELPVEVKQQVLLELKERHYRRWMDEALPVLRGKTPREASKTRAGRERLKSLLKKLENTELRFAREEGIAPFNTAWMWRELGLTRSDAPASQLGLDLPKGPQRLSSTP
jgi:SEC-C motif